MLAVSRAMRPARPEGPLSMYFDGVKSSFLTRTRASRQSPVNAQPLVDPGG